MLLVARLALRFPGGIGCDGRSVTHVHNQESSVGTSDGVDISRGLISNSSDGAKLPGNSCRSSSSNAKTTSLEVREVVEVREYDPNTPLAFGAANSSVQVTVTDTSVGKPIEEAVGSPIAGLSMTCVVAGNSCRHDNAHDDANLDIGNHGIDPAVNLRRNSNCNGIGNNTHANYGEEEEEEAQETSLRHAADVHSRPRADSAGGRHVKAVTCLRGRGAIISSSSLKRDSASRADSPGLMCQSGSEEVSIEVRSAHGVHGRLNGEAAEAHQPRESRIASGDTGPMLDHAYQCGTPIAAGGCRDLIRGPGRNGIGLPDVGPGSVRPVIPGCLPNARGPIEGRFDTPPHPAAPKEGHATAGDCTMSDRKVAPIHPAAQEGRERDAYAGLGLGTPGSQLRREKVHLRIVSVNGARLPSRASGATLQWVRLDQPPQSASNTQIQPLNSDAFQIRLVKHFDKFDVSISQGQRSGSVRQTIYQCTPPIRAAPHG